MKKFEIKPLDATRWELFIDGHQTGQYSSIPKAKAAARRFLASHEGITWDQIREDGCVIGRARPKAHKRYS